MLFTDIVDSTRRAVDVGDRCWRQLLDEHDRLAQQIVSQHCGNLIKSTGDGILATFDGPGRAIRCALALGVAAKQIGLPLRAGLHTGEIEIRGKDIGGFAADIKWQAGPAGLAENNPFETCMAWNVGTLAKSSR